MHKICLIAVIASLFIPQAFAETKYLSAPVTSLFFRELIPSTVSVKVLKVIDPLTFIGEDKIIYALSSIEVPNSQTGQSDMTKEASAALAKLIEGKDLIVYQTKRKDKGRTNRMNQSLVHASLKQEHLWIQGELLAMGMARVMTTQSNPELVDNMLKAEADARKNKRGLWSNDNLQILTPENAQTGENAFGIVEGAPKSAAVTNNMVYLNFSDDWKKDFTIGIPSSQRMAFSKKGLDPQQLTRTKLRVRGYIRSYNGPFIEIDHPEQIEILDTNFKPVITDSAEPAPNAAGMRTINLPKPPEVEAAKKPEIVKPEKPRVSKMNE